MVCRRRCFSAILVVPVGKSPHDCNSIVPMMTLADSELLIRQKYGEP
jgi:hypothetical protein